MPRKQFQRDRGSNVLLIIFEYLFLKRGYPKVLIRLGISSLLFLNIKFTASFLLLFVLGFQTYHNIYFLYY